MMEELAMTTDDLSWVPSDVDTTRPNPARVYDYLIGGANNFEADRKLAKDLIATDPNVAYMTIENRAFLRRAVGFLAKAGIDQFLDLGSGIPTVGHTHEVAQRINPLARVVYVDMEAVAVAHSQIILAENANADIVRADIRDPEQVLQDPVTQRLIDFTRPVAVLMFAVVHFIKHEAKPAELVKTYRDATVPGSYLALSHGTNEDQPRLIEAAKQYGTRATSQATLRNRAEIRAFFDGYELLEPGVVFTTEWRPELPVDDPANAGILAGVGTKI
jgi:SAM-dependent methyltransferase